MNGLPPKQFNYIQPSAVKPASKVGPVILVIVLMLVAAAAGAGAMYLYTQSQAPKTQVEQPNDNQPAPVTNLPPVSYPVKPTPVAQFPDMSKVPASWKVYNNTLGYAFAYPAKYQVTQLTADYAVDYRIRVTVNTATCDAMLVQISDTAHPVDLGASTVVSTAPTKLGSLDVTKTVLNRGGNAVSTVLQGTMSQTKNIYVTYAGRCTAADIEKYGLQDQDTLVNQMLASFQFAK